MGQRFFRDFAPVAQIKKWFVPAQLLKQGRHTESGPAEGGRCDRLGFDHLRRGDENDRAKPCQNETIDKAARFDRDIGSLLWESAMRDSFSRRVPTMWCFGTRWLRR